MHPGYDVYELSLSSSDSDEARHLVNHFVMSVYSSHLYFTWCKKVEDEINSSLQERNLYEITVDEILWTIYRSQIATENMMIFPLKCAMKDSNIVYANA